MTVDVSGAPGTPPLRLVLTGCGSAEALAALFADAAPALARRLALPLRPWPGTPEDSPQQPLARLAEAVAVAPSSRSGPEGWLSALPLDPGLPLADGGSWAEALAAWRQPTVLLLPAAALDSGLPAAATALQRLWRVPLLGLLQVDGPWDGEARRRDGLPWLGGLSLQSGGPGEDPPAEPDRRLQHLLQQRLLQCDPG